MEPPLQVFVLIDTAQQQKSQPGFPVFNRTFKTKRKTHSFGPQILLCVTIVIIVSPSCVKITPNKVSSFSLSLHESILAKAVMDAVNSHGFKNITSAVFYVLDIERVYPYQTFAVTDNFGREEQYVDSVNVKDGKLQRMPAAAPLTPIGN